MTGLAFKGIGNDNGNGNGLPVQPDDAMMLDIDWVSGCLLLIFNCSWEKMNANISNLQGEWDKIFPPEVNTGVLNMPSN
jgi:hypothetical protein